ncbi:hypothetical protein BRADI_3g59470v3 [Brachypodium distachyon]|uniref:Uncharacterized protein n=1 Tax=Brachypodium distachyon TaxID=15368 RepID=I1IFC2_BRADI|nr:hypothetical protein BRADI_3g59470v3 [Brachypodium distachyon]
MLDRERAVGAVGLVAVLVGPATGVLAEQRCRQQLRQALQTHSLHKPLAPAPQCHRLPPPVAALRRRFGVSPRGGLTSREASAEGRTAIKPLLDSTAAGLLIWFIRAPAGVARNAWQLLAVFLATIVRIITQPWPLGADALLGLGSGTPSLGSWRSPSSSREGSSRPGSAIPSPAPSSTPSGDPS